MSMWNEKPFLEELEMSQEIKSKLLRQWFGEKNIWQHPNWARRLRRKKLLPSWETLKWKTSKLRKKYRNVWNTKTLVANK